MKIFSHLAVAFLVIENKNLDFYFQTGRMLQSNSLRSFGPCAVI